MEKIHKDALRKTRTLLVRDITPDAELWDLLQEKNIFTPIMMEYIQAEKTKTAKNRKMLDDLVRRGPKAYKLFLECLRLSSHENLADAVEANERQLRGDNQNFSSEDVTVFTMSPSTHGASSSLSVSASTSSAIPRLSASYTETAGPYSSTPQQVEDQSMDVGDAPVVVGDRGEETIVAHPEDDSSPAPSTLVSARLSAYDQTAADLKYRMESSPRGYCLIINNKDFTGMDVRQGTDSNRDALASLFTELGFVVHIQNNLPAVIMKQCLEEFSAFGGLQTADSVIIALLSHGDENKIYGSDGQELDLKNDIFVPFSRRSVRSTLNKPKFFIVNACRGDQHDQGTHHDSGRQVTHVGSTSLIDMQTDACDARGLPSTLGLPVDGSGGPTLKDFYIAYSTFTGYVSYRQENTGSHFIQSLVDTFRAEAHRLDINALMTQVNNKMSRLEGMCQMPSPVNMLTKQWYLNPPPQQ